MTSETSKHDEFWKNIANNASERIHNMFKESGICLKDVIGGDGEIRNYCDAKKALSYILCHADNSTEKACAILSACEWLHSCNELHENI